MKDNQSSAGPLSANTSLMRPLAIEVFDHAIGLWPSRLDQAKFDAMCLTLHIEGMAATGQVRAKRSVKDLSLSVSAVCTLNSAFSTTRFMNARASILGGLAATDLGTLSESPGTGSVSAAHRPSGAGV